MLRAKLYNKGKRKKQQQQQPNKMQTVRAIVYFFKKWCTCQLPRGMRVQYFYICHSSINTPTSLVSFPPRLLCSIASSCSLSVLTLPLLKCVMRGGSQDNWPCVSWVVWSRNAAEATHLRAAQQTVKCSTGGRTQLQREQGDLRFVMMVKWSTFALVCVYVWLSACLCDVYQQHRIVESLTWDYVFVLFVYWFPPPPKKQLTDLLFFFFFYYPNARGSLRAKALRLMHNLISHFTVYCMLDL